ncbi:MAG TPA: HEAT repeat domain-containing protein [Polyangia bacterium]|jgi:HEAT repeat protein
MMRLLVVAVLLGGAAIAHADTAALVKDLADTDEARAIDAATALGKSSDPKAIEALVAGLDAGTTPKAAVALCAALGVKKDARGVVVLMQYAHHREPEVRKAALAALAAINDKRVAAALSGGLGDSDAEVRAAAAKGIADRRDKSAEDRLVKLMEHRDPSAAGALAAIATPELAHRLSEMLGTVPDPILCTALGEMLKRADFGPEPIRVEVVRTLSKVPGVDSTAVLVEYVAATERDKNRPSRLEAQKIVDDRSRP